MRGRGGHVVLIAATLLGCILLPTSGNARADEPIANDFWGSVYADGNNAPNGVPVRAVVDGVIYGSASTFNVGVSTTYLMSTEGDDDASPEKDGIVPGDLMTFWVDDNICDETYSNWQPGQVIFGIPIPTLTNLDLHYSTFGQPTHIKINEVTPDPPSGEDWIEVYNPSTQTIDLSQYRLEDNDGFTQALIGMIDPQGFLAVTLGGTNVLADAAHDEMKISWRDPAGTKAQGNWVVVDRMEYGPADIGPDDTAPSNGDMGNAPLPPSGVSLELEPDGSENNHPNVDYTISSRPDSTEGYTNLQVQPLITVTAPPTGTTNVDLNFTIMWSDDDPDDNADISLYYDEDDQPGGETLVANLPLSEDLDGLGDQYLWDTSSVPEGIYFVKAMIDDRVNPPTADYSPGRVGIVHPPRISILQPDGIGDTADDVYNIQWADSDGDDNATITLWYDADSTAGGENLIGQVPWGEDPDGFWDIYPWRLDSVQEGAYFVKAVISDGSQIFESYSPGQVSVVHPPSIVVLQPDGVGDTSHREYRIQWTDRDADDNATITLYYDIDTIPGGETLIVQVPWGENPDGQLDSYLWNTRTVPTGTYFIKAVIDDGKSANYSYSMGPVIVLPNEAPEITLIEPGGPREASQRFTITWIDRDPDDNATITLYYDIDQVPGGLILIGTVPQGEDSSNNSFVWIVMNVPEGIYYIWAFIDDGLENVSAFSAGTVHVMHQKNIDKGAGDFLWILIVLLFLIVFGLLMFFFIRRRKKDKAKKLENESKDDDPTDDSGAEENPKTKQEESETTRDFQEPE